MNDLRKSWGQQECSPAGRTHGISLCSREITPTTLPTNSHTEWSTVKKKSWRRVLMADEGYGTVTCMEIPAFTDSAKSIKRVCAHLTLFSFKTTDLFHLHFIKLYKNSSVSVIGEHWQSKHVYLVISIPVPHQT